MILFHRAEKEEIRIAFEKNAIAIAKMDLGFESAVRQRKPIMKVQRKRITVTETYSFGNNLFLTISGINHNTDCERSR